MEWDKNRRGTFRFIEAEGLFGSIKSKAHRLMDIRAQSNFTPEQDARFIAQLCKLRARLDELIESK